MNVPFKWMMDADYDPPGMLETLDNEWYVVSESGSVDVVALFLSEDAAREAVEAHNELCDAAEEVRRATKGA